MKRRNFLSSDKGLVTLEWVGIAAVVVIAAFAISAMVLQGADALGGAVANQMSDAAAEVDPE